MLLRSPRLELVLFPKPASKMSRPYNSFIKPRKRPSSSMVNTSYRKDIHTGAKTALLNRSVHPPSESCSISNIGCTVQGNASLIDIQTYGLRQEYCRGRGLDRLQNFVKFKSI